MAGIDQLIVAERVPLHGRLTLTVVDPSGEIVDEREGDNVICTTGYTAIAAALVWSGVLDQADNLGITTSTDLTPLYGAVGSGVGVPAASDIQLFTELGRETVGGGASTPASASVGALCTWSFFFPNPTVAWTVTEAGVFANASSATNSGSMIDHWLFSPSVLVPTINTLILQVSLQFGP